MCIICNYIINYPFKYYMYKKAPEKDYSFPNTLCINCMKLIYDKKYTPNTSTAKFKRYSLKNRKNVSSKRKSSKRQTSKRQTSNRQTSKRQTSKRQTSKGKCSKRKSSK